MKISLEWMTSVTLLIVLLASINLTQKKMEVKKEKWNHFECGFNTMNPPHIPFSLQFFLVALLFLIFDIEISLVLSYPMEPNTAKNTIMISSFLLILTIGLLYEWQKSKMEWSK